MSGFDHSAFSAQLAGQIAYVSGERRLSSGTLEPMPYTEEPLPPRAAEAYQRLAGGEVGLVALTVSTPLFAGKLPQRGESLRDQTVSPAINYRVVLVEGGLRQPTVRLICKASPVA